MSKKWKSPFESAWFCAILAILAGFQLYDVWTTKHKVDLISAVYFICYTLLLIFMRKKIFTAITGLLKKESKNEE